MLALLVSLVQCFARSGVVVRMKFGERDDGGGYLYSWGVRDIVLSEWDVVLRQCLGKSSGLVVFVIEREG